MDAATLVVGDVFRVRGQGWVLPCDAVLVSGTALLDESTLTGENPSFLRHFLLATEYLSRQARDMHMIQGKL